MRYRSSVGKNILKIFGSNDPQLVDPDAIMVNRGENNNSEKNTENRSIMNESRNK